MVPVALPVGSRTFNTSVSISTIRWRLCDIQWHIWRHFWEWQRQMYDPGRRRLWGMQFCNKCSWTVPFLSCYDTVTCIMTLIIRLFLFQLSCHRHSLVLCIIGVINMYPSWHVTMVTWRTSDVMPRQPSWKIHVLDHSHPHSPTFYIL